MATILSRLRRTRRQRSAQFAATHFGGCRVHVREAMAVHAALELMCQTTLEELDPEATIRELLPRTVPTGGRSGRILGTLDLSNLTIQQVRVLIASQLVDESVMKPLLGPAHRLTGWDASTIWSRSVRGVINERVRHHKGCTCDVGASRPTRG